MPFDIPTTTPTGANYAEYFARLCREFPPLPDEDPEARAARIREAGGLPGRLDFGPPEPEIVAALLRTRLPAQAAAETGSASERNSRKLIQ